MKLNASLFSSLAYHLHCRLSRLLPVQVWMLVRMLFSCYSRLWLVDLLSIQEFLYLLPLLLHQIIIPHLIDKTQMFLLIPLDLPNITVNKIMDATLLLDNTISSIKGGIELSIDRIDQIMASRIGHKGMMLDRLGMRKVEIRIEGSGTGMGQITIEVETITMIVVGIQIIQETVGMEGEMEISIDREGVVIMEETEKEQETLIVDLRITRQTSKTLDQMLQITTLNNLSHTRIARNLLIPGATSALEVQVRSMKVPIERYDDKILPLALLCLLRPSILVYELPYRNKDQILLWTNLVDSYDQMRRTKRKQKWRWRNQFPLRLPLRKLTLLHLISSHAHQISLL